MSTPLILFLVFIAITLGITYWASRRTQTAKEFYAAGRAISGWQNGIAVAGDYMSAASFLGIAGLIALNGYDGFMYSVGFLVAYLTVLLIVAEPLRNVGKYTMADMLAFRMKEKPVRAAASLSTLTISTFYMVAQMIGAGQLVSLLLKGTTIFGQPIGYTAAVWGVGILMLIYVIFGGMLATTWVQIIKAILLMVGTFLLSILVVVHFGGLGEFFHQSTHVLVGVDAKTKAETFADFSQPGLLYKDLTGKIDLISLGLALILGTAGLPHILVRFYTVPNAKAARTSVAWAMGLIGVFYIMTTFLGFGAASIVTGPYIKTNGGQNMAAPLLAQNLGGDLLFAFICSIAFATILAVVAGLTITASTSFAHDFWLNIIKNGKESEREQVTVARITSVVVGLISILLSIVLQTQNVAFLVALAFAVAASANLPVIIFSLFWRRFNTVGAITGILTGLISALVLIAISPSVMAIDAPTVAASSRHLIQATALFPLSNPGLVSIPLGFLGAFLGTFLSREPASEAKFTELTVRANTGIGAES